MKSPSPVPVVSVVHGDNADLIEEVSRLYLQPEMVVADVTFGMGAFWTRADTDEFYLLASDIDPSKEEWLAKKKLRGIFIEADFTALPYEDESVDIVVLDPPYIHSPGKHMTDARYGNSATTKGMYHADIMDLYRDGMGEAMRVLKPGGFLWVKCKDQVMSSTQQWSHIDLFHIADRLGMYQRDLFVLVPTSRTSMGRWKTQFHARKVHSYLLVFEVKVSKTTRNSAASDAKMVHADGTEGNHDE